MTGFQIVKLTPDDWQAYKQLRLESLRSDPQAFATSLAQAQQSPDAYWQDRLRQAQEGKKSWLLFAKEGDRLIGMIGAFRQEEKDTVAIISMFVTRDKRGQGVATALMEAMLNEVCQDPAIRRAMLTVNVEQAPAVNFYKQIGFQIIDEEKEIMGDGKQHRGYLMERPLNQEAQEE